MKRKLKIIFVATLMVAVIGIGGWFAVDAMYTEAELVIRVHTASYMDRAPEWAKSREEFGLYVQTQVDLLRSTYVIGKTLRRPAVSQLPIVQSQKRPDRWLSNALEVTSPEDSEFVVMRLRIRSDDHAVTVILNEIADVYMGDGGDEGFTRTSEEKNRLSTELKSVQATLHEARRERESLVPKLRRREARTMVAEQKVLELMMEIKRETNLDRKLELRNDIELVEQIAFGKEADFVADIRATELDKEIAIGEEKEGALASRLAKVERRIAEGPGIRILQPARVTTSGDELASRP